MPEVAVTLPDGDADSPPSFWHCALSAPVMRRAVCYAIVVGTVLVGINHGRCVLQGHFESTCAWQSLLTVCVPYIVSTLSSVQAIRNGDSCRLRQSPRA